MSNETNINPTAVSQHSYALDIYISMLFDSSYFALKQKEYLQAIDRALDEKNHDAFIKWSQLYKDFLKKHGETHE